MKIIGLILLTSTLSFAPASFQAPESFAPAEAEECALECCNPCPLPCSSPCEDVCDIDGLEAAEAESKSD